MRHENPRVTKSRPSGTIQLKYTFSGGYAKNPFKEERRTKVALYAIGTFTTLESNKSHQRFDDLTDTIFAGHHQPLKVWILCLYFMGLNLSNEQSAHELSLHESDAYQMTTALRGGIVKKSRQ